MLEVWLGIGAFALVLATAVAVAARRWHRYDAGEDAAAVFRARRRELRAEAAAQQLDSDSVATLEEELALELVDAGEPASQPASLSPPPRLALLAGAALAVALALGLYAYWGEPNAPLLAAANKLMAAGEFGDAEELVQLEAVLARRVDADPDDMDSWFYLGHLRLQTANFSGAAAAFGKLHALAGGGENIDLAWAQASFLAAGRRIDAATREIVDRVMASRPDHPSMLELLAMDAIRRGSFAGAVGYLERALRQPLPDRRRALLAETQRLARQRLDPERPLIDVTVTVGGEGAPWLMVFARPQGGGMPLAVVRRPARATQAVTLDDAVSMNPALPLSAAGKVEVVARLSQTGTASGDGPTMVSEAVDAAMQPQVTLTLGAAEREIP